MQEVTDRVTLDPKRDALCTRCGKGKVFIGSMCEECYNEQAYPGGGDTDGKAR